MNRPTLRTLAHLLAPWRTIRRLERANDRLCRIIEDPFLSGVEIGKEDMTVGMRGTGPGLLAGMFMGLLEENPQAVNYLEATFKSPKGPILVTVVRPGGATPHNLRAMAEQEARGLRAELERLQGAPEEHF